MLSDIDVLLALVYNRDLDKKAMKKLTLKLSKRAHRRLVRGLLSDIMEASDHRVVVDNAMLEYEMVEQFEKQFLEAGHQGMVLIGGMIVPVCMEDVDGELPSDWTEDEETEASLNIADIAMNGGLDKRYERCTVVLFEQYGFSGIARDWAMKRHLSKYRNIGSIARKSA